MNLQSLCGEFERRLDDLLDQRLDPNGCPEIRRHAARCRSCRARLDLQSSILNAIAFQHRSQEQPEPGVVQLAKDESSGECHVGRSHFSIMACAADRPGMRHKSVKWLAGGMVVAALGLLAVFLQGRSPSPLAGTQPQSSITQRSFSHNPSSTRAASHPRVASNLVGYPVDGQAETAGLLVGWWPAAIANSSIVWSAESESWVERRPDGRRMIPDLLNRTASEWGMSTPDRGPWIDQQWFVPVRGGLAPLTQTVASTLKVLRATVLNGRSSVPADKSLAVEGA